LNIKGSELEKIIFLMLFLEIILMFLDYVKIFNFRHKRPGSAYESRTGSMQKIYGSGSLRPKHAKMRL
jgi:hypothetical protein